MIFKNVDISLAVRKKCDGTPVAANLGNEIPAHLFSLLKPTRTLMTASLSGKKQQTEYEKAKDGDKIFGSAK